MTLMVCGLGVFTWRAVQPKTPIEAAPASISTARPIAANPITHTEVLPLTPGPQPAPGASAPTTPAAQPPAKVQPPTTEPSLAEVLIGSWQDDFYGKRIFHFRPDGTATMTIELDRVGQVLYGPKLTFFIDWTLKDDLLSMKMTGGEPMQTATAVAKLFGETSEQRVERFSDEELTLRSLDSQKLYVHRRITAVE